MLKKDPLVSVIIAAFNVQDTIYRCLISIVNQTYTNLEILVVDDGSTDHTSDIILSLANKDSRIHLLQEENKGVAAARNFGIRESNGKYIMFCDADDQILECHIERYVDNAEENNADVVIGGYKLFSKGLDNEKVILPPAEGVFNEEIWNFICQDYSIFGYAWNKLILAELVKKNNIFFDVKMRSQEDLDFYLSYYQYCKVFSMIKKASYCYFFESGKRKPPYEDFIKNQLKLAASAEKAVKITSRGNDAIKERIFHYIFSILNNAKDHSGYVIAIKKLDGVIGLRSYLKTQTFHGRDRWVAKQYMKNNTIIIYVYLVIRQQVRKLLKRK